ncbi:hypothetical protein B0H17DRAFT_1191769 [Mycena rosella]|uniref:Uncharacterized protein n=1 Tax=Mycena rosella TaxID=1033263 RepID=A0AAD7MAT2_MYCRO|nr:hypothetical protein B0H17DRAFT_1191769 [Mycena rosella]
MSFISNADHVTLKDGVYNNVHGNIVHHHAYVTKWPREELDEGSGQSAERRRRELEREDGIPIVRDQDLKLTCEIGSGPEYFIHAGSNQGRAVIVKVFKAGPIETVRKQLESTVALSKGLMYRISRSAQIFD